MVLYAIIRIRGTVDVRPEVESTLNMLRLRRKFAASLYSSTLQGINGVLKVVENWATWGEIELDTLEELFQKRGKLIGDKPITDDWVKEKLGLSGIRELAEKLLSEELMFHKLEPLGVKPFFRLHPPRGGFKGSIKKHYGAGGELGYRGKAINELLKRMI